MVRPVNVREWMLADHADVGQRFQRGVADHLPSSRWAEPAPGGGSTIAWLVLHHSYHQDLAINTAVRDRPPLLAERAGRLGLDGFSAAVGLEEAETATVTGALDPDRLMAYADDVHASTQDWLGDFATMTLDTIPDAASRLAGRAGVGDDEVGWLYAMWEGKPVSWFIRWEAIGHGFTHVGEMVNIRKRMVGGRF